jgi:3-oxo-5-alpha-steroid 4-dehydrogenase 3
VLLIQFIPAFRTRFLAYGKTAEPLAPGYKDHKAPPDKTAVSLFLDTVATIRVPHGWFTHFYVACVACNLFWGCQIVTHGAVYQWFSSFVGAEEGWKEGGKAGSKAVVGGQTVHQVVVVWALLLIQGSRRLYECVYVTAPGTSKMWVGHYLLGIAFYIAMSVAIWVEGTGLLSILHVAVG